MSSDQRQTPRVETNIEILFKEKGSFIKSYMLNVSHGGLFIKTGTPLPIDSFVNMKVTLPDTDTPLDILGRVVWINARAGDNSFPQGMGIQFYKLDSEHREIIDGFVEKYRKEIRERSIF